MPHARSSSAIWQITTHIPFIETGVTFIATPGGAKQIFPASIYNDASEIFVGA